MRTDGRHLLPRTAGGQLHADTARFLFAVGPPSNKFFSPKLDLDDAERLQCEPSLKAAFEEDQAPSPPGAEAWEILGEFQYATIHYLSTTKPQVTTNI